MDFASNLIAAITPLIFALLVGGAFWLGLRLHFRAFGLTLLLAPIAALGMAADHVLDSGRTVVTTVIVKEEQVSAAADGRLPDVSGRYVAQVRLPDGAIMPVEFDSPHFDALAEGDPADVTLFAQGSLHWTWAKDFNRLRWLVERLHGWISALAGAGFELAAGLAIVTLATFFLRRDYRAPLVATLVIAALSAALAGAAWGDSWRALDRRGTAIVVDARLVSETPARGWLSPEAALAALVSPYYEVRLRWTPEGGRDGVTAIDRIDVDGLPPKAGQRVSVAYSSGFTRHAEMVDRSRTFAGANRLADILGQATWLAGGIAALLVALTGLWAFARRRARPRYSVVGTRRGANTNL